MNQILPSLIFLCAGLATAQEESPQLPPGARVGAVGPTTSVGRPSALPDEWGTDYQIQAFGENPIAKTEFLSFCRDLRHRFRWSLFRYRPGEVSRRSEWIIPLRVEVWGQPDDVYKGSSSRMGVKLFPGGRFEIWVAARLHDDFVEEEFRIDFVRALIAERMIEPYVTAVDLLEGRLIHPPAWLVHGFDELLVHRRSGRPSAAYSGVLQSGRILSPEEIFAMEDTDQLDPIDYTIFRMSAAAMVETLLDQPDGDIALRELLGGLVLGDRIDSLLRQHFPAFREMEGGIQRWWVLQVASLGQMGRFEFTDRVETESMLNEALMIRFVEGESIPLKETRKKGILGRLKPAEKEIIITESYEGPIEDYQNFVGRPGIELKLNESYVRLQFLKQVGFPLYRPLFDRYGQILEKIAKRQLRGLEEELEESQRLRDTIGATLVRTEDFLNHYEATQAPRQSDAFDEYRKVRDSLDKQRRPAAKDRISRFLDVIESSSLPASP